MGEETKIRPARPELPPQVRELVEKARREDAAASQALSEPNPGVLRDVFAVQPDIPVGKYRVRPFYDRDHEFLAALNHPLEDMVKSAMQGKDSAVDFLPTGAPAWQLCWIMTRPVKEVSKFVRERGLDALRESAADEFGECQLGALAAICLAVTRQMSTYIRSVVAYGPAAGPEEEGAAADAPANPAGAS